tara:strand:+ start:1515 stop:2390 length:876 start_codon:yes stop_codon:yes gene_type:complete
MLLLVSIQEFLDKAGQGEVELPDHLIQEFKDSCEAAIKKQFSKREGAKLRMSGIGRPVCQQILSMQDCPKESSYNDIMRFLFGDLIEAVAMLVIKAAGIKVVGEQKPCSIVLDKENIKGTLDVILDEDGTEKVWDIKSASPFSFDQKFKNGYDKIKEDDPFGYIVQGHLYGEANNMPFGGWIVINKSTGEWAVVDAPEDKGERVRVLQHADNIVKVVKRADFKKAKLKDDWETYRKDGEMVRTKNRLMPKLCSFCEYKKHCWEDARFENKITSKAKSPPQVWYTRYVQRSL